MPSSTRSRSKRLGPWPALTGNQDRGLAPPLAIMSCRSKGYPAAFPISSIHHALIPLCTIFQPCIAAESGTHHSYLNGCMQFDGRERKMVKGKSRKEARPLRSALKKLGNKGRGAGKSHERSQGKQRKREQGAEEMGNGGQERV